MGWYVAGGVVVAWYSLAYVMLPRWFVGCGERRPPEEMFWLWAVSFVPPLCCFVAFQSAAEVASFVYDLGNRLGRFLFREEK